MIRYADFFVFINTVDPVRVKFLDEAHIVPHQLERAMGLGARNERSVNNHERVKSVTGIDNFLCFAQ
jgi:hypothetical protein